MTLDTKARENLGIAQRGAQDTGKSVTDPKIYGMNIKERTESSLRYSALCHTEFQYHLLTQFVLESAAVSFHHVCSSSFKALVIV